MLGENGSMRESFTKGGEEHKFGVNRFDGGYCFNLIDRFLEGGGRRPGNGACNLDQGGGKNGKIWELAHGINSTEKEKAGAIL